MLNAAIARIAANRASEPSVIASNIGKSAILFNDNNIGLLFYFQTKVSQRFAHLKVVIENNKIIFLAGHKFTPLK